MERESQEKLNQLVELIDAHVAACKSENPMLIKFTKGKITDFLQSHVITAKTPHIPVTLPSEEKEVEVSVV